MTENVLQSAVKQLRQRLGKTQTEFGQMLGKALPTIQRWEGVVPPSGPALAQLNRLALESDHDDLAKIFIENLKQEMFVNPGMHVGKLALETQEGMRYGYIVRWLMSDEEREFGRIFSELMDYLRSQHDPKLQKKARAILESFHRRGDAFLKRKA